MNRVLNAARTFLKEADLLLLALCLIASIFGVIVISSATAYLGSARYVVVQCMAIAIGVAFYILSHSSTSTSSPSGGNCS